MAGDREMRNDRRMTDVEALMWNLEKDPHLSASIANVTVFDRSARRATGCGAGCERAVAMVPRLRQRVVPALGRLAPPEWRDDPDFDLDYHLRWLGPAGTRDRCGSCSTSPPRSSTTPFDRTRPLWEFVVVEGLEGGRAAMVQKLHHTIADGEGGIRMSEQFIDLEPRRHRARSRPDRPVPEADRQPTSSRPPSTRSPTNLRRGLGVARRTPRAPPAWCATRRAGRRARPTTWPSSAGRRSGRSSSPTAPASPLWTERSLRRRIEVLQVPLDDAKAAAKALGGSLNDIFVAAAAGGAGAVPPRRRAARSTSCASRCR